MEELRVSQESGVINTNLDAIEANLKEYLKNYEGYVVTADSITDDKKVLAELRKLQKSLDDARKAVKKEWEKPYKEFEERCKQVISMVDVPIDLINQQLKLFEEERAAEKLAHVKEVYAENIGDLEKFLPFDSVFNPKWTNVSTKDQDIIFDLQEKTLRVKTDLSALQALKSEIYDELIETYISTGNNLALAIQRNNQYLADKNRVAEQLKEEVREEVKAEQPKEEPKPNAEAMGTLNEMVEMTQTVHIIISKADLQAAKNALDFSEIKYQVLEGK